MKARTKKSGLTLMEMTVVIAGVAMLACFGLPVVRTFLRSFESPGGARAMISSAMASARAIAAKEQHYAGIRFQQDLNEQQHVVFIINEPTLYANGFVAIQGLKPIKLPGNSGVASGNAAIIDPNTTRVSIIFSPSGKLVANHKVRTQPINAGDEIFNIAGPRLLDPDEIEYYSENSIVIYDIGEWNKVKGTTYESDFLAGLETIYINPYTGTMISVE